ncbi:MAG: hypothetical protein JSW67_13965 [Candidatus Latescibacterota bacterium]|nr:MAG: hypothetical protein JSW67_13965 [Candidatus Latescibacterota bacterium]
MSLDTLSEAQENPTPPAPRDVTVETLKDPKALAALETPGTVLFEDGFESKGSLKKYFEIRGIDDGRVELVSSQNLAHRGQGAIQFKAPAVERGSSSSGASGWLGSRGHDRIYFRRYIRFAEDYDQGNHHHTGGSLAGVAGDSKWSEMGRSGVRPNGADRFTCAFEPARDWGRVASPGFMMFYTYWVDMQRARDGKWWGNMLAPTEERRVVPPRGKWVCLEQMIQVNTIGEADGELAAWIDGELYLHMTGFRWRTSEKVRIKRFNLGIFVHEARRTNSVWYDDVVLSTGYIGP